MTEAETQPELIQTGWYWTGSEVVWAIGVSWTQQIVYYQFERLGGAVLDWERLKHLQHWQRVHEVVQESGKGFDWHPPVHNP